MSKIDTDGRRARQAGASYDDNPWPPGSVDALSWRDAWTIQDLMSGHISQVISKDAAALIWKAHREIDVGAKLLDEIAQTIAKGGHPTPVYPRDHFNRGYTLGVPEGNGMERIFNINPELVAKIVEAHIADARRELVLATAAALTEAHE